MDFVVRSFLVVASLQPYTLVLVSDTLSLLEVTES
jgi:hypothetical protein